MLNIVFCLYMSFQEPPPFFMLFSFSYALLKTLSTWALFRDTFEIQIFHLSSSHCESVTLYHGCTMYFDNSSGYFQSLTCTFHHFEIHFCPCLCDITYSWVSYFLIDYCISFSLFSSTWFLSAFLQIQCFSPLTILSSW